MLWLEHVLATLCYVVHGCKQLRERLVFERTGCEQRDEDRGYEILECEHCFRRLSVRLQEEPRTELQEAIATEVRDARLCDARPHTAHRDARF